MQSDELKEYNATRNILSRGIVCHAPTVNLNFDQSGAVTACCYNRKHVLGRYPTNSLVEMWEGEPAQQLREYIKEGDLSHGCQLCEHQLKDHNYYGTHARHFDKYASDPREVLRRIFGNSADIPMPRCMEFELSNICNLECTMCNGHFSSLIRKNRENLPELRNPYDDAFVDQLKPFLPYLKDAKFLGGEPFLVPIYYQIWELIASVNPKIKIHITTNGTVYNNRVKSVLDKLKCGIIMSIDSIEKQTYESIRINANYDRVMANIEHFRNYARSTGNWFSFAVCPMTLNWQEIPDLVRYCNANRTYIYFNTVISPEELSLRSMSSNELQSIVDRYEKQSFSKNGSIQWHNQQAFASLTNQIKAWQSEKQPI